MEANIQNHQYSYQCGCCNKKHTQILTYLGLLFVRNTWQTNSYSFFRILLLNISGCNGSEPSSDGHTLILTMEISPFLGQPKSSHKNKSSAHKLGQLPSLSQWSQFKPPSAKEIFWIHRLNRLHPAPERSFTKGREPLDFFRQQKFGIRRFLADSKAQIHIFKLFWVLYHPFHGQHGYHKGLKLFRNENFQ